MTQRIVIKTAVTKANEVPARPVTYQYHWRRIGVVGSVAAIGLAATFYGIVNSVSADEQPVEVVDAYQSPEQASTVSDVIADDVLVTDTARVAAVEDVQPDTEDLLPELVAQPTDELVSTTESETATIAAGESESGELNDEAVVAHAGVQVDEPDNGFDSETAKQFAEDARIASVAMAAQVDTTHVSRAVLTTEVVDREPVNVLKDSVEQSAFSEKLYFFTEVRGLQGQTIRHLWFHQDQLMAEIELPISAYRHRTYSSKNIMPSQSGQWRIEAITADDRLLAQKTFRIIATAQ
ncbi:hypothetical protein CWB99_10745 [Pseudoalteromonas rubra]|uniref:DUF2914 domain-containing protein n=1 Tax=Pseudoalteromonas rubra TaxID=43658 RepID=A0A5S3WM22_9GAMM|nr:DUF2914 domain-containing protein [Pseudoalteromonas rubra]TMP28708.1 hypothetical protein CWB99_10745 [Pseudoalteromonas rubra]TMP28770.1 hypothetical protein CWC00_20595 [Pseudoalteromonas rubra]